MRENFVKWSISMKVTECSFENFEKQLFFLQNFILNIQKTQYNSQLYYLPNSCTNLL